MLQTLRIRDFAIIAELELRLAGGFVVFTGETGAGKSIIVDAVQLLLGGRAEATAVRTGAETALVEGEFALDGAAGAAAAALLEREGLVDEPGRVVLGREVRREGRSLARVNGRSVGLSLLREIGELLVDVHGQSEHLSLLRVREHLALLDRFAENEAPRQAFAAEHAALVRVRQELDLLRQGERDAARRSEMLEYAIQEIEAARVRPGEKAALKEERLRLANAERLAELAALAEAALAESTGARPARDAVGGPGAIERLGQAAHAAADLAKLDPALADLAAEIQGIEDQAAETARRLRRYRESLEFNPRRLEQVEERLATIHDLERKYGEGEEAILAHLERARLERQSIAHAGERIAALAKEAAQRLEQLGRLGSELSKSRRAAAARLGRGIESELQDLQMAGARFDVDFRWEDDPAGAPADGRRVGFTRTGLDLVEFLVAPNPGEGLKPLAKIASGGETSRLMLGLKSVLARADHTPTLIFDEIDQGIGGRVGGVVGHKLWRLARNHQVLCITHLPQLAAHGDQHFRVEKVQRGGRTFTTVGPLTPEERLEELAQMLGGATDANRRSASELLDEARRAQG